MLMLIILLKVDVVDTRIHLNKKKSILVLAVFGPKYYSSKYFYIVFRSNKIFFHVSKKLTQVVFGIG